MTSTERRTGRQTPGGRSFARQPRVDSLDLPDDGRKGIHQQSSTETSGIGSLGPDVSSAHASTENVNLSPTGPPKRRFYAQEGPQLIVSQPTIKERAREPANRSMHSKQTNGDQECPMDQCGQIDDNTSEHSDATNFDELFEESSHRRTGGSNRDTLTADRHERTPKRMDEDLYEQSRGLLGRTGSRRGGKGKQDQRHHNHDGRHSKRFLAAPTSAWLQWSEERRESYKRRKELMAQKQKEMEDKKVPTPVKKARKESLIFVAKADEKHLIDSEDEVHHLTVVREEGPDLQIQTTPRKAKKPVPQKVDELNLTPAQWKIIYGFWQHTTFVRARHVGLICAPLAYIFGLISCFNDMWSNYEDGHHGLWTNCTSNPRFPNDTTPIPTLGPDGIYCGPVETNGGFFLAIGAIVMGSVGLESSDWLTGKDFAIGIWGTCYRNLTIFAVSNGTSCDGVGEFQRWQVAVIALIIFSMGFSLLANILALCGLCSLQLPRKVYFYHSAAEIYFVCALSSTTALVTYPAVLELQEGVPSAHTYSWGYMVGWGAPACFYISSICMSMDDMIHSVSKGCKDNCFFCPDKKATPRTPMNHV